jgi:hypothetical protein
LTASFNHKDACNHMCALGLGGSGRRTHEEWQAVADEAHVVMMDCLTRFRVLASDDVADVAKTVQMHNERAMQLIWRGEFEEYEATRATRREAMTADRNEFTSQARRLLGVTRAVRLDFRGLPR